MSDLDDTAVKATLDGEPPTFCRGNIFDHWGLLLVKAPLYILLSSQRDQHTHGNAPRAHGAPPLVRSRILREHDVPPSPLTTRGDRRFGHNPDKEHGGELALEKARQSDMRMHLAQSEHERRYPFLTRSRACDTPSPDGLLDDVLRSSPRDHPPSDAHQRARGPR